MPCLLPCFFSQGSPFHVQDKSLTYYHHDTHKPPSLPFIFLHTPPTLSSPCRLLFTLSSCANLESYSSHAFLSLYQSHVSPPIYLSLSFSAMKQQDYTLQRSTSTTRISSRRITPSTHHLHNALRPSDPDDFSVSHNLLIRRGSSPSLSFHHSPRPQTKLSSLLRSFLNIFSFPTILPTCKWLTVPYHLSITPSLGRKVTGTLFGNRRGHVSFAVQLDPRSEPLLVLELAMSTSSLVKEMSSGLVRIALECEKLPATAQTGGRSRKLFQEPNWIMYCNGRKCGYAVTRACGDSDWHVLSTVQSVSVGAGVIPVVEDGSARKGGGGSEGELLYMRARFERVVGSRDSEAFYMLNPDGNGGPELSIFLLKI